MTTVRKLNAGDGSSVAGQLGERRASECQKTQQDESKLFLETSATRNATTAPDSHPMATTVPSGRVMHESVLGLSPTLIVLICNDQEINKGVSNRISSLCVADAHYSLRSTDEYREPNCLGHVKDFQENRNILLESQTRR